MKKRVVIRSGSLRMGGLERVLIEVLQTINKEKYNISLVIDDDCGEADIFKKDIPKEIDYYFLKSETLMKKISFYREKKNNLLYKGLYNFYLSYSKYIACKNMEKLVEKFGKIDILIDFDAGAAKYIEKIKADKKIVWIHNSIPSLKKKKDKIERFGKRLANYDEIVAICDEMKEELISIYPYLKDKVVRIYNPFNFERIEKLSEDRSELKDEDLELLNENYIIAISRLDNVQKDYPTLLKAMEILKNRKINEKLFIVGDGPSKNEIEQEIKKLGLEDNVKLLGKRKNPYIWLKESDFFVHSSKYEGLPTVLIEALICNKFVISSNCPTGPKEILANESCGKLFEVGNYEELANLLEKYILNEELRKEYSTSIENRREEFNKNIVLKEYEKLIDE
ncbi:glycosyltransferase [Fusobacterium sp. HC1336]|uniref:glycosyltransferase n=1 Tax=Fusobacterium sp. HC1336 TaxID=3171169 RepID=UPI003F2193D7